MRKLISFSKPVSSVMNHDNMNDFSIARDFAPIAVELWSRPIQELKMWDSDLKNQSKQNTHLAFQLVGKNMIQLFGAEREEIFSQMFFSDWLINFLTDKARAISW